MRVELKGMTHDQLNQLIAQAKRRRAELEKGKIAKVRRKVQAMIESEGLTVKEVLGELRKSHPLSRAAVGKGCEN